MVKLIVLMFLLQAPVALASVCPMHDEHAGREPTAMSQGDCHGRAEAGETSHDDEECCLDGCPCTAGVLTMMSMIHQFDGPQAASGDFRAVFFEPPSLSAGVLIPPPI